MGALNLAGQLRLVTGQRETVEGLHVAIGDVELKFSELTIRDSTPVTIPLNLSPTITEALVLVLYCAKTLTVTLAGAGSGNEVDLRMKGLTLMTLAPEGGVTRVDVASLNPTPEANLSLFYAVATAEPDKDPPAYWDELCRSGTRC